MPPVWSIIEMLQMLGRGHRINSGSTTRQWVVWYRGTIEESVYQKLQDKALSMRELFRKKEQWSDLFVDESAKRSVNVKDIYAEGNERLKNSIHDSDESEDETNEVMDADLEIASNNVENEENEVVTTE
jgi:ERCC4-related helicase